jgi:signal peptidase I
MNTISARPRSIISILWIGVLLGPVLVMLWLGRGRLALLYLLLQVVANASIIALETYALVDASPVFLFISPAILLYIFATSIIAVGHGLWLRNSSLSRPWYRWIAAVPAVLYSIALLLIFPARVFLFQPFNSPSKSNFPNLAIGDHFFVSKYSYGYTKYSFPFHLATFEGHIWAAQPKRGDFAVFRKPTDPNVDYVKRLVGLPGDRIQMKAGVLYINGAAVGLEPVELPAGYYAEAPITFYRETLPGGRSYVIADIDPQGSSDDTEEFAVPDNHYFALGDNRDNSQDSRHPEVGFVPFDNLIGPVAFFLFTTSELPIETRPVETREASGSLP